jgi:polysaccharide export outer membrane protein
MVQGRRTNLLKVASSVRIGFLAIMALGAAFAAPLYSAGRTSQDKETPKGGSPVPPSASSNKTVDQVKGKSDQDARATRTDSDSTPDSYRIGVEDELQISVWHEPELSMPVQVRPDGMITLPLVNDLSVVGLTTHELQATLSEKLKPFVNEPQVTVIVRNIRSRKVYLMGQVGKPGPYPLNGRKTVLQLITEAGGPSQFARTGSIYIIRTVNGQQTRLPFNYKKALSGKPDAGDISLLPGDMVVIP